MTLRIAPDLELPDEVLDAHVAILGKTGSGKSNLAKVLVEGLLDAGERVCVIDPTGTWYGLRLERDRTPSPYPVVMFGGEHADIAIAAGHGAAVAESIGTTDTPAVIDTLRMSVAGRTEFFTAFAETLLQRNRGPLHLVIDEAHLFAPQGRVNDPRSGQMVHAANNLVSLGRGRGLRITLITQRPAKLHKDSLTQVETLIALRLVAPQDRRAVDEWIGEAGDARQGTELRGSLPGLRTGEAWIWNPQAELLVRRHLPLARTLDTGRPSDEPIALVPIDVEGLRTRLLAAADDAVASDTVTALRARVRELERQLRERPMVEMPVELRPEEYEALSERLQSMQDLGDQLMQIADSLGQRLDRMAGRVPAPTTDPMKGREADGPRGVPERSASSREPAGGDLHSVAAGHPVTASRPAREGAGPLGKAERLTLAALARYGDRTPVQVAILTGYSANGGGFRNAIGRLRGLGLVEGRDRLGLTAAGRDVTADIDPLPTGRALLDHWLAQLGKAERMALETLAAAWPGSLTVTEVAEATGYEATGGGFRNALGKLRTLQLITGTRALTAAAELAAR